MNEPDRNPYTAPEAPVQPPVPADGKPVKAERMTRLGAALADGLISLPAALPLMIGLGMQDAGNHTVGSALIGVGVIALIALAIYNCMLLAREGQTIGKRWLGIRIVRSNGERASFGRLLGLRILLPGVIGAIPGIGPLFSLADPLWIFGEERRCLHDHIADTIVVIA